MEQEKLAKKGTVTGDGHLGKKIGLQGMSQAVVTIF